MMLADAEDVEPGLIREPRGAEDLGVALLCRERAPGKRIGCDVTEGVDAEFHASPEAYRGEPTCTLVVAVGSRLYNPVSSGQCSACPSARLASTCRWTSSLPMRTGPEIRGSCSGTRLATGEGPWPVSPQHGKGVIFAPPAGRTV